MKDIEWKGDKKKAPLPQKEKGMGGDVTKETSGVRTIWLEGTQ